MSEMVERVARALHAHDDEFYTWAAGGHEMRQAYRAEARAALEAMREPTDEMVRAITPQETTDGRINYRIMIDAALRE